MRVPGSLGMAVLMLLLTACGNGGAPMGAMPEAPTTRVPVEVAEVREGTIMAFYSATATLESDGEARIVPRIAGRVVEILAEEGDRVEAGQTLARIDDDRLRLELARAETDLSRLRQDLARQGEMHQRNLIATEVFERLQYEVQAQQAQVDLVSLELSYTDITAPISGVVSERMVRAGNMVNTSEPVFMVTAMEPLQAILNVPERELARLQADQPARLQVDALPGELFMGQVARISPVVDSASGTFRVTIALEGHGGRLRPGMFGRFHIVYDSRDQAVLVPVAAVMNEDGRQSVFVVEEGEAQRRSITVGHRNNGEFEVREGLEAGERVVVIGQASLRSGVEVQVIGEEPDVEPDDDDEAEPDGTDESDPSDDAGEPWA